MAEYSAAGELDRLNPNPRLQQRPDLPLSRAPSEQNPDFKKTSSFQITSVTVSSSVSNDGEDDSCGEVEDSQIEPPEPAEASPDSEEDFVEKPVIHEGAKLEDKEHGAALGPRFKVVRIDNEPFKRGRWLCVDYLDQPSHPKEELTDEVAVHHHHAATLQYPIQPPAPTLQGGQTVINTQVQQSSIQVVAHSLPASAAAAVVAAAAAAQYPQPPPPVVPIASYPVSSVSSAVVVTSTNPVVTTPSLQQVVVPAPVPVAPPTFVPPVMPVVSQPVFTAPAQQQQYVAPPSQQQVVPPPLVPAAAAAPPAAQLQPLTVLTPSSAPQPPPNSIPPPTQQGAPPLHPVVLPTVVVVPHPTGTAFDVMPPPQQQQHIQQIPSNYQAPEVLIQQQTGTVIHPAAQPHLSQPQLNPMAPSVFTTTASSSSSSLPAPHPTPQPAVDPMGLGKAHGTAPAEDAAHGDQEHPSASGSSTVAIDNKIEQAMDLVKSHLMFAVREEVEVLKERIAELMERIAFLETENGILRSAATQETLAQIAQLEASFPTASAVESGSVSATSAVALPPTTATSQPGNNNNNGTSPAP